jgi:hypothetical protein
MQFDASIRELASSVDALYLSARPDLPEQFVAHRDDCREWAVEVERKAPCEIDNATFGISPYGWGHSQGKAPRVADQLSHSDSAKVAPGAREIFGPNLTVLPFH